MIPMQRYLQVYAFMAILTCLFSFGWMGSQLGVGMVIAVIVFGFNLWGGIWAAKIVVGISQNTDSSGLLQFLVGLKFFLFISSIIVIFLAFGWVPVLVGNSLIILTVIFTTLYYAIYPKEGV